MGAQQREILYAFVTISLFLALVIAIFFYFLFRQHKKYRQLQKEKLNAEISASETERNFIATELHNDLGPFLVSLKMRLHMISTNNPNELESCLEGISHAVNQIRMISRELAPMSLFTSSFLEAIELYVSDHKVREHIHVDVEVKDDIEFELERGSQVYRIIQEIIQNTIKHAQATTLSIEISKENKNMLIRTADDGVGFDMKKIKRDHKLGLGVLGIQSRVDFLNGSISINPESKRGTQYNIRVPI